MLRQRFIAGISSLPTREPRPVHPTRPSTTTRPLSFLRAVADALTLGLSERLLFAATISKRARSAIERTPDLLLVGLRNPGYDGTRHNAGEICVERLMAAAGTFSVPFLLRAAAHTSVPT